MTTDTERARQHVLDHFAWFDGHADLTAVFGDPETLAALGPGLAEPFLGSGITVVVGAEARAFMLGPLCAVSLGVGFVPARKPGARHPGRMVSVTTEPDWRNRRTTFRIPETLGRRDRVLLVDDWIETGSQATAIASGITSMGATLIGTSVIVDQASASVRAALDVIGLVAHDELPVDTE